MAGAHRSCPAPSDSTGSSSLPEKGRMIGVVSTHPLLVSTQCFKHKAKYEEMGVDTGSSSVDTGSSSVDTGSCSVDTGSSSVDIGSSSVDTRDLPRKPFVPIWDSVSTLDQVVSTLEAFPENI
ncbi:hypothetical protein Taro_034148 [Colocasia esculenta]|uniref:Uncharacterized protein n=1 Tax=Colocasia esculenta TaxID=4460 RepID=A0A843VQI7_COLES|nr:hypothetical protein [Colocasia esculenta]